MNKYAPLVEQKAVTQQDYDNAVQTNVVSKAEVEAAKAESLSCSTASSDPDINSQSGHHHVQGTNRQRQSHR